MLAVASYRVLSVFGDPVRPGRQPHAGAAGALGDAQRGDGLHRQRRPRPAADGRAVRGARHAGGAGHRRRRGCSCRTWGSRPSAPRGWRRRPSSRAGSSSRPRRGCHRCSRPGSTRCAPPRCSAACARSSTRTGTTGGCSGKRLSGGSDSVVVGFGPGRTGRGGATGALLKASDSPQGQAQLRRQTEVLRLLRDDERLAEWHRVLPRIVGEGDVSGSYCVLESRLPGSGGPGALRDPRRRRAYRSSAVATISEMHRCTAQPVLVDEHAAAPLGARPDRRRAGRAAAGAAGRGGGARQRRSPSRCAARSSPPAGRHGDYTADNVLADDDGRVVAVVDWCDGRPDGLAVLDVVTFLLTSEAVAQRGRARGRRARPARRRPPPRRRPAGPCAAQPRRRRARPRARSSCWAGCCTSPTTCRNRRRSRRTRCGCGATSWPWCATPGSADPPPREQAPLRHAPHRLRAGADLAEHVVGGQHTGEGRALHEPAQVRRVDVVARDPHPGRRPGDPRAGARRAGRERRGRGLEPDLAVHHAGIAGLGPQRPQLGAHALGGRGRVRRGAGVGVQLDHRAAGARRPLRRRAFEPGVDGDRVERRLAAHGVEHGSGRVDVAVEPEAGHRERRRDRAGRRLPRQLLGHGRRRRPPRAGRRVDGQHDVPGLERLLVGLDAPAGPPRGSARTGVPVRTCTPALQVRRAAAPRCR